MKRNLVGKILGKIKIFVQDFVPIRTALSSVTKSSTARFSHENLVKKIKIFVQDFVPIRTALTVHKTPELTKLQAVSYVGVKGVRYTWPLELAHETELRWKNYIFC